MPAIPLFLEGAVDLGVLVCFVFLIALSFAYTQTLGLALNAVAHALDSIASSIGIFGFLFSAPSGWIHDLDNAIKAALGTGISATEYAWHKVCHFTASTVAGIGQATAYVAAETLRGFETLVRHWIPYQLAIKLAPVAKAAYEALRAATAAGKALPGEITRVVRVVRVESRTVVVRVPAIARAAVQPVAVAGAVAGALVFPRLHDLERQAESARANVAKLSKWLTVAGAAGLVSAALSHLGLGSQRCSNVKRLNRGLCGVNPKWIEDLLLGAVSIFGTLSLVKLAEDYQKLIGDVTGEVQHFWRADVVGAGADRKLGQTGL